MSRIIYLSVIFLGLAFSSCEKQKAEIPSYISIKNYNFKTDSATEGSASNDIKDSWVFVDDQSSGAYEIPARFPVLFNGTRQIKIRPGIFVNGSETIRAPYPFYSFYVDTITLVQGSITEITPTFTYNPGTKFGLIEEFENSAALKFSKTSKSDTSFNLISGADVFEGSYSASIDLNTTRTFFEAKSFNSFTYIPGANVFLEMNCKTNYAFSVGVIGNYDGGTTIQRFVLQIQPAAGGDQSWRKLYINLAPTLGSLSDANNFQIFIVAENTDSSSNPKILIDNVKLVGA